MKINLLPADTYKIYYRSNIDYLDKKIITMLYQPIIGYQATALFFTLYDDFLRTKDKTYQHYHLMTLTQMSLDTIIKAREKLEAIGLLKTYLKKDHVNNYIYQLYSPLTVNEFFNHPILNIVLYNNLGKNEYNEVLDYFKVSRISPKDFEEISKSFKDVYEVAKGTKDIELEENILKDTNRPVTSNNIDFNLLEESIPKKMISDKCFNNEVKELINDLSYIYKIETLDMISLVRDNINERGMIDKINLRKDARNYYQFENNGRLPTVIYKTQPEYLRSATGDTSKRAKLIYSFETTSPYDLLASKCKTGTPSQRDIKLIENLMIDMKLNPGVINVLIAYVLHINNQKLSRNYVEAIAGQWKRLNIETVEEALRLTDKEYKKNKKPGDKKTYYVKTDNEKLPIWFDKDINNNSISEEESKELNDILNKIGN